MAEPETPQPLLIPIHSDGDVPEWAMIEVNGELILPKEFSDKENPSDNDCLVGDRVELGAVHFEGEKPIMVLGSHQLTGTVETLKQAFCVLQKQRVDNQVAYHVTGVVTRKLLFNQYPKIIMR